MNFHECFRYLQIRYTLMVSCLHHNCYISDVASPLSLGCYEVEPNK